MGRSELEIIVKATDQASSVFNSIGSSLGGIGKIAMGVAAAGIAAVGAGLVATTAALADFTQEAMAAQEIDAQLDAVLKSTAGAAGMTKEALTNLATGLSEVTRYEDDVIQAGENMLLTFTNIGKDVFPLATETILDMSTALGQDLKSSAIQLGKALNDPVDGMTALQRVGVKFTDDQKKQVEAMVKANNIMGAQKLILKELQTEFGGSAKAAGQTFAGQMDILKNTLGNVKEEIGAALLPILADFASKILEIAKSEEFKTFIAEIVFWFKQFGDVINKISIDIQPVKDAFSNLTGSMDSTSLEEIITRFQELSAMIQEKLQPTLNIFAAWWATYGPEVRINAGMIMATFEGTIKNLSEKIMPFMQQQLGQFQVWFAENGPLIMATLDQLTVEFMAVMKSVELMWLFVEPLLTGLANLLRNTLTLAMQIFVGDWEGAWKSAVKIVTDWNIDSQKILGGFIDWVLKTFVGTNLVEFGKQWKYNFDTYWEIVSIFVNRTKDALNSLSGLGRFGINIPSMGAGRAAGGSVSSGMMYPVGENGPEWFVPNTSGVVRPGGGSGSQPIQIIIQGDVYGDNVERKMEQAADRVWRRRTAQGI